MNNNMPKSFTVKYLEVVNVLETSVRISEYFDTDVYKDTLYPLMCECTATWDTGAMISVISINVIEKLGLEPIGKETVGHGGGISTANKYLVNIFLPNEIVFTSLEVLGMPISVDILIGMDIISKGDFVITASQGKTKFSFQIPSTHDTDYEKKLNQP